LIQYLTSILLPSGYEQRRRKEEENLLELEKNLPIFVCAWTFPKIPMHLHVFEPRYRLMMRRAMEGQRVFGMAAHTDAGVCRYGTLLRIEELRMLPDGRSLIAAVGVRKFKIGETGVQDGYLTASVTYLDDDPQFDEEKEEVKTLAANTLTLLQTLLESIPVIRRYHLLDQLGPIPSDPSTLPYWIASLTQFPLVIMETLYFTTDPFVRLQLVNTILAHLTGAQ